MKPRRGRWWHNRRGHSPDGREAGMGGALKLLIVEDQSDLAANIWDFFARRGHVVDHAADGESGLRMSLAGGYDAIVLDLGLPRLDGLLVCRRLRQAGHGVPVLMLTARDTLEDKLKGFAEGADDYLVKPFALRELEARVTVLSRRGRAPVPGPVAACGIEFDARTLIARREGRDVVLTRTQARILECLMRAAPGVVETSILLRAAWGAETGGKAALHTHMYALRAVLDKPFGSPLIQSAHGVGYRLGPA
jgi:DNA-binding response OmpR family regulator